MKNDKINQGLSILAYSLQPAVTVAFYGYLVYGLCNPIPKVEASKPKKIEIAGTIVGSPHITDNFADPNTTHYSVISNGKLLQFECFGSAEALFSTLKEGYTVEIRISEKNTQKNPINACLEDFVSINGTNVRK